MRGVATSFALPSFENMTFYSFRKSISGTEQRGAKFNSYGNVFLKRYSTGRFDLFGKGSAMFAATIIGTRHDTLTLLSWQVAPWT
jgi:hypothetical protein